MLRKQLLTILAVGLTWSSASAWDQDPFAQYLQRSDTITLGAGNAQAANTVTHMITPWPPYAFDRRIPGNGERMVGAVQRYRDVGRIRQVPCPIVPQWDTQTRGLTTQTAGQQCGASPGGAQSTVNVNSNSAINSTSTSTRQ